jgi:hypothetical protein
LYNFFECGNVKFKWEEMGSWGETEIGCSLIINRKFPYMPNNAASQQKSSEVEE